MRAAFPTTTDGMNRPSLPEPVTQPPCTSSAVSAEGGGIVGLKAHPDLEPQAQKLNALPTDPDQHADAPAAHQDNLPSGLQDSTLNIAGRSPASPLVSIIIPLHNKGPYVRETLESVLAQTVADWEALVVENHSTDDGPAQVAAFAARDARITLIQAPPEVWGPGAARNLGLAKARGEWVLFLDADDLLEPYYLERQFAAIARHPDSDVVVSGMQKMYDDNSVRRRLETPSWQGKPIDVLRDGAIAAPPWVVHAALIRRSLPTADLLWPEHLDAGLGEDTHFWFRILRRARIAMAEGHGAVYRYHTPGCRTRNDDLDIWYRGIHAATCANVGFLRAQHVKPNLGHAIALFEMYVQLYMRACTEKNVSVAAQAKSNARHWLATASSIDHCLPLSAQWARRLGIGSLTTIYRLRSATTATFHKLITR